MQQRLYFVAAVLVLAIAVDPPVWPESFEEAFD